MLNNILKVLWVLALGGCATIASGTSQSVTVDTFNAPGATCKGIDKKGREYYWVNTPASATVQKGDAPLVITCEKTGFKKTVYTMDETINAATFGNIIAGGLVGVLVDATSGAAQEYQSIARFPLEPDDNASEQIKEEYKKAKLKLVQEQMQQDGGEKSESGKP